MHPFIHAFTPAIAPPWQTRTDFDAFHGIAKAFTAWPARTSASARTWSPRRCCTTPPTRWPRPAEWSATGRRARRPGPRQHHAEVHRGGTRLRRGRREDGRARAVAGHAGHDHQGRHRRRPDPEIEFLRHMNGTVRGGVADGRPSLARDIAGVRGDPGPVRHHQRAARHRRASTRWSGAPGSGWPTWPPSTRASRSASPTRSPGRCR